MTPADTSSQITIYSNKWSLGCYAIKNVSLRKQLSIGHNYSDKIISLSISVSLSLNVKNENTILILINPSALIKTP